MEKKIIVIVGPTSSGKTALAISIAKAVGGEIISADSRQVYKELNLLSGKVTEKEMLGIKHHLLSVTTLRGIFSVSRFERLANRAISEIQNRKKIPILCGGTGLYIDSVIFGSPEAPVPPNKKLREELSKFSIEELFIKLKKLDPVRASNIDQKNRPRIERAIEIATVLGSVPPLRPLKPKLKTLWIGLTAPKEELTKKIEKRIKQRLKIGMVDELKKIHKNGISWKRLESLGLECRWISKYLNKKISKKEMFDGLLSDTKDYARRQMTWFKRNKEIIWLPHPQKSDRPNKTKLAIGLAKKFLKSE